MDNIQLIPIEKIIVNQYQPAEFIDQAQVLEIADSIRLYKDNGQKGLLQIPLARQVNGYYEEAFGRHRLLAFQHLAKEDSFWSEMPLIVKELSDREMFELMGIENFKRRDVTVVEKARIFQDYMTRFNATSVQTAERFGETEEYVRGTVRLNKLPDEAKEKLAKGEITITAARSLLSMQKVAGKEAIVNAVERIAKGEDRWGNKETPDEVIEEIMDELTDDLKTLWHKHWSGKPRGGDKDSWLLDMKNFPVNFLPALTPVDLAMALDIQDDERVLGEIEAAFLSFEDGDGWELIHESLKGRLADRPDLLEKIAHLVKPPACSACPFYSVVQGTHYCGMVTCFDRKSRAWQYEKLRAASKDLKIEIYNQEMDGEFRVLEDRHSDNGKKHMELFQKRSKDLRLALAVDIDRKKPQAGYQGVPSGAVVMLVGKTLKTLLETSQQERAEKRSKDQLRAQVESMKTVKRELMDWEVAGHVKSLFDGLNMVALQSLWEAPRYGGGWEIGRQGLPEGVRPPVPEETDQVKEDFFRQLIAVNMVRKIGGYYNKPVCEYAAHLAERVKTWGVKLPRSITKLAAQMDAEIAAVTAETD
jgi:ParB/RepB/Spo0J family partition protein